MKSTLLNPSGKPTPSSAAAYWDAIHVTLSRLDWSQIDACLTILRDLKARGGRLFILGVGGSAANASHAVNDFRKIAGIEAYAPTDNVAELTARTNDSGWEYVFETWLATSHLNEVDVILVLSVGGGSDTVSGNLIRALNYAEDCGAGIIGVVGRDGGYTRRMAQAYVHIPAEAPYTTPLVESFQPLIWHYWVTTL